MTPPIDTTALRDQLSEHQQRLGELDARLSRKTKEVEIIQAIASEVNSTLNLAQILDTILSSMRDEFGFEHSMVLLLDESGEKLRVVASRGYRESGIGAQVLVGQGTVGVVAKHKKMMRVSNIGMQRLYLSAVKTSIAGADAPHDQRVKLPGLENAQSQIALPLLAKDHLIGVFAVESPAMNAFDELDEALLKIVGNLAASSIDNASLYSLAEERLEELDKANSALAQFNESLEEKVRQRTAELSTALQQLTEAQDQLILQEKMASLGHLVAGIAHEINNPIGVVNSAVDVASRCLAKIESSLVSLRDEQLEKLLKILKDSTEAMRSAGERMATLVKSLRVFAHLDEAEFKRADLHSGLDTALALIQSELRERIAVVKEYGEIPLVYCSPGQINQVFMSLLLNAAQAIKDTGEIRIKTFLRGDRVHVQVSDTGSGIPPERLSRIFEFGFSRERARVKMGTGLSTSYNILKKHRGDIAVESAVGKGSTFTVILPIENRLFQSGDG